MSEMEDPETQNENTPESGALTPGMELQQLAEGNWDKIA